MARRSRQRVVVIGAGHNGLVCASLLARRGMQVTLLEALRSPGGMAGAVKFAEGFRTPRCAHLLLSPDARVVRALRLYEHGFAGAPPITTFSLHPDGPALRLQDQRASLTGNGIAERDVAQYRRFCALTARFSLVLARLARRRPPRLGGPGPASHLEVLDTLLAARSLRRADARELLRVGSGNVHDVLDDYLDHEQVKAAIAMDGVLGAALGPRSNNSMLNLLHRNIGRGASGRQGFGVRRAGGPGAGLAGFVGALGIAARESGVELRTGTPVHRILSDGRRASGVELADGELLHADAVVSSMDVRTTLECLVGVRLLDAAVARRVRCVRSEGRAAKLHLALGRMPAWRGLDAGALADGDAQLRFLVAPDRTSIERAFDPSKYGELPERPALEFTLPSVHDPTLCASGRHVLSAVVQHVPLRPRLGLAPAREALLAAALDVLESVAPDLRECIEAAELMLPADLEAKFGVTGGHWHHGELAVDQYLMLRPMGGAARYASPLAGLWLCGAATHPGGNVMGSAGFNAASEVIRSLEKRR